MALFLISLESGRGKGHSNYLLALRLLDDMGFAMEATLNRMGGGHTLQSYSLGARDKCPHPSTINSRDLFGTGRGTKV